MLRHTTTYRLEGAHSTFHRLLAWGHNYFTCLGKEVVVLTPGTNSTYKISQTKDKTWVKVKFVAKTILSFTLVIPAFAFLLKLGAWRFIHIDHTPVPRPSNIPLKPSSSDPFRAPPPSPAVSAIPAAESADASPESSDPAISPKQEELRSKIWGEGAALNPFVKRSKAQLHIWLKNGSLDDKIAFIKAYRLANTEWEAQAGNSFMSKTDQQTWTQLGEVYKSLQPSSEGLRNVCGPTTPFHFISEKFDGETFTVKMTAQEAADHLKNNPALIPLFNKHCEKYGFIGTPLEKKDPNARDTPGKQVVREKAPHVVVMLNFAFEVAIILMQAPHSTAQTASRDDIWQGTLAFIPTGPNDLKAADLAASVTHVEFLKDYQRAKSAWGKLSSTATQEEQARWKLTEGVFTSIKSTVQNRLGTFQIELTAHNGKNRGSYASSIKGQPKEDELRGLLTLVNLVLSASSSSAPQQKSGASSMKKTSSSPLKHSGLGTQSKAIDNLRTVIKELDQPPRTLL